jgi:predicted phosphodiesterase
VKKIIILVFSDPHITEKAIPELKEVFKEILSYEVNKLIMLGDYYHFNQPSAKESLFGTKWAKKFKDNFDEVIYLRGTGRHDKIQGISCIDYLKYLGIKISDNYVINKMFFGHFMLKESKCNYGESKITFKDLEKHYNLSVLGHFHQFQKISRKVYHLGSCRFVNFGEVDYPTKYIALIKNGKIEFKRLKSIIPIKDVESINELNKLDKRTKVRVIFNDWEQYKKEVNQLKKWDNYFIEPIRIKLNFKMTFATKSKKVAKVYSLKKLLLECLQQVKDEEVKELIKHSFKEEGLLNVS